MDSETRYSGSRFQGNQADKVNRDCKENPATRRTVRREVAQIQKAESGSRGGTTHPSETRPPAMKRGKYQSRRVTFWRQLLGEERSEQLIREAHNGN